MWIPHEISIAYPHVSNSQLKGIYNTQRILEECIIDNEAKPDLGIYVAPLEQTDNPHDSYDHPFTGRREE
jgi:hypothetical protein